ncbi:MAG: DNA-binding domain-containing protein [Xenococcaceae cyanobacterium]
MCSLVCFMVKPQITVRLSPSLLMELDKYVQNSGTSKTDVVVSAIATYIGCNENVRINQRVAELELQMKELKTLVKSSSGVREFEG